MNITKTLTITDPKTESEITFEPMTREQYLAQRAAWRANYADLSAKIRKTKHDLKAAQRAGLPTPLHMTREILRDYAREAMEERRIMKLKAAASYEYFREQSRVAEAA